MASALASKTCPPLTYVGLTQIGDVCCRGGESQGPGATVPVELTAGGSDVFVTAAADLRALSRYMLERLEMIPGITDTRTRISTQLYRDGSHWRLGGRSREASAGTVPTPHPTSSTRPTVRPHLQAVDRKILVQLGLDGRSSSPRSQPAPR